MKKRRPQAKWRMCMVAAVMALLISACLPEGMRVPQSEFSAALERKVGLIAYLSVDGNVYTIDQGGNAKQQVTTDAFTDESRYHFYGMPIWSRNSQSLAFASFSGSRGDPPSEMGLLTANKDGGGLVKAYSGPHFVVYYYWAPDGRHLGFISETPNRGLSFQVVPPEGGEARLVDAGAPYYWTWSPDGSAVLAHAGGTASSQARLALLQLGPEVTEFGLNIKPGPFKAPAFAPDGSQVLVAGETDDGRQELLLSDVLGDNTRALTEYTGNIAFAWSPNGSRVAHLVSESTRPGSPGKLTVIDPSGKQKAVQVPDEEVYAFFWAPNSRSIAYFVQQPFEAEAEAGATEAPAPEGEEAMIWLLKILDVRSGRTHTAANLLPTERFMSVIPYFDQYHQSQTIWSPDSKNLVISAYRRDGTPGIWVVAASGKLEPRYIADGWMGFWSWK